MIFRILIRIRLSKIINESINELTIKEKYFLKLLKFDKNTKIYMDLIIFSISDVGLNGQHWY